MALGNAEEVFEEVAEGAERRFVVTIISRRKRLLDQDNLFVKATLDAIVRAGLIPDDSPRYLKALHVRQEKGKPKTIITIEEVRE